MKNPLIFSLIALVLGAAALASHLLDRSSVDPRDADVSVAVAPNPGDSLADRIEELTEENRALRDRLSALELRPVPTSSARTPATAGFVPQEEFDAFRDEVREALAGSNAIAAELATGPGGFKDHVATTLTEIRRDEAVDKARARQEGRPERLDETMPKIETWLDLTPNQSSQMRSALLAQYDSEAELTRRWEAGEDSEVLGEIKRSDREAHLTELSSFLTPAQLESYSAGRRGGGK